MGDDGNELLLFQNFTSAADVSFWKELARRKLEELGLDDAPIPVTASFRVSPSASSSTSHHHDDAANTASPPILLDLSEASFAQPQSDGGGDHGGGGGGGGSGGEDAAPSETAVLDAARVPGLLINFNTVEGFKKADKTQLLQDCMQRQLELPPDQRFSGDSLARFVVICYADLKKHVFVYWVGFPTLRVERSMLPRCVVSAGGAGGGDDFAIHDNGRRSSRREQ